ncbi:hypothetical protein L3X38_040986 [Prunus dulcis]|uniref:Uncharacterized protein n=1 Tax=Prunus dulcis TaxID=3755 RepID=A0AAD4YKH5_PRUDU|nr:hypothetical protein L3X38_040986 [Prunus dulcis]
MDVLNYKNGSAHSNGVKEATADNIDVASLPLSNNEGGLSNQFSSLEFQNREQNGRVDDLSASKALLSCSPFVQLLQELRTRKCLRSLSVAVGLDQSKLEHIQY